MLNMVEGTREIRVVGDTVATRDTVEMEEEEEEEKGVATMVAAGAVTMEESA